MRERERNKQTAKRERERQRETNRYHGIYLRQARQFRGPILLDLPRSQPNPNPLPLSSGPNQELVAGHRRPPVLHHGFPTAPVYTTRFQGSPNQAYVKLLEAHQRET